MSQPKIVQSDWKRTIPQLVILAAWFGLWFLLLPMSQRPNAAIYGVVGFFVHLVGARHFIPRAHRRGVRHLHKEQFREAIACFADSDRFFSRHPWIDRFRAVVLLSPSSWSYREMALLNMAFAHSQLGEGRKAQEYYRQVATEYPGNKMARNALRLMEASRELADR